MVKWNWSNGETGQMAPGGGSRVPRMVAKTDRACGDQINWSNKATMVKRMDADQAN
jgi:hypothetical protein